MALPPLLFFHQGSVEEGRQFFHRHWPEARAVSDRDLVFYEAFGLKRGGVRQVLGPSVWGPGLRALLRGAGVGKLQGDPWMMSGLFLVQDDRILWRHRSRNSGDLPEFAELPAILGRVVTAR